MRKFLIAGLVALMPTVALAGGGFHGGHGGFHNGGFHHRGVGIWPFVAGAAVIGGAYAYENSCWRIVYGPYGPHRVWVCDY